MKGYQRRDLAALAVLTLIIAGFGIWRLHPHYLFFDSAGAIKDALLLLDRGFIKAMDKGGNAHLWFINLGTIILTPYWLATDQLWMVFNFPGRLYTFIHEPAWNAVRNDVAVVGRFMSVTAAAVTVATVYLLAQRLYTRRAGWLAALITIGSMGFVTTAKMATEDVAMVAAVMVAIWLAVIAVDGADRQYMLYSAVVMGLAGSLKAPAAMAVPAFTLAAYWVLKDTGAGWRSGLKEYGTLGAMSFLAYVVTTPSMLRYSAYWLGQIRLMTVASVSGSTYLFPDPRWLMALVQLALMMSGPLFLVVVGLAALGWLDHASSIIRRVRTRRKLTTDQRAQAIFVVYLTAMAVFVGALTSPQYYRVLPMIPVLAIMAAGVVVQTSGRYTRPVAHGALALALVFAAVYTGTAVVNWNTTRPAAAEALEGLPPDATVATLAQRVYLPPIPDDVEFESYHLNYSEDRHQAAALRQFKNRCHDYVLIAHNHYHRFYRDPSVDPNVNAVMRPIVRLEGYQVVDHYGPPIPRANNASFWWGESFTLRHYANSVGNSPITLLRSTREPAAACGDGTNT